MTAIHALLVGIDDYRDPALRLRGCRNDTVEARQLIGARRNPGTTLHVRELHDAAATRAAVIDGFRSHLRRADPDDTALFWFSGHGSVAPVPPDLWYLEPDGRLQTLVCADSRHDGVPDLLDKELALLLDEVASSGCHVVTVLDCCHSGGAVRGDSDARVRVAPSCGVPAGILSDLARRYRNGAPPVRHVSLAACRPDESAREETLDGRPRGLFSWALADAMRRSGPTNSYRDLVTLARGTIERRSASQVPQLLPIVGDLADRPFLGGAVTTPGAGMVMRYGKTGWEIDAGRCHGLSPGAPGDPSQVAVRSAQPVREARLTRVDTTCSTVEPIGWSPDPDRVYPVVLSRVPVPRSTVAVDAASDPATAAVLMDLLATAGPAGASSPHVRLVVPRQGGERPELRVRAEGPRRIRIDDAERNVLVDRLDARQAVSALEHIARWHRVRELHNPVSQVDGAVRLEIVPALPGEHVAPLHRPALGPDPDGAVHLAYRRDTGGWQPPTMFIRLRNTSQRRLHCVLLDLTDRFRIHGALFPGAAIGPGLVGAAADGQPVEFRLPDGRAVEAGVTVRDWLLLLVTDDEASAAPFEMPGIDRAGGRNRTSLALHGLLDRIGRTIFRDVGPADPPAAGDWATTLVPVVTGVPDRW